MSTTRKPISYTQQRPVARFTVQGLPAGTYDNAEQAATELARETGQPVRLENIRNCCTGNRITAYGFVWRYLNHDPKTTPK